MDFTISSLVAVIVSLGYLGLLAIGWHFRKSAAPQIIWWFIATLSTAILVGVISILPPDTQLLEQEKLAQPALLIYAASLLMVVYGCLSIVYLQQQSTRLWLVGTGLWWMAVVAVGMTDNTAALGQEDWLSNLTTDNNSVGLAVIGGWTAIGVVLFLNTFHKFYRARLPEIANQALYWGVVMPLVLVGCIAGASGIEFLREVGWVILFAGIGAVSYGVIALRVVDVRETLRTMTINMLLALVTAIAVLIALLIADEIDTDTDVSREILLAGLALATATIHAPAYLLATSLSNRMIRRGVDNVTGEISRFAQAITGVVEMEELAKVVVKTLDDVLRIKRSSLILVTKAEHDDAALRMEPYNISGGEISTAPGYLKIDAPVYNQLFKKRKPLRQYELDFAQEYRTIDPSERDFFRQLRMAAFAPIVVQAQLIGILACGSKANDAPFSDSDLELLSTIANQTGIALRNARLVDDLRRREHDVAESNKRLEATKRQLEALDAVKTDFVTIASHELRTPLAQFRGHTDIIEALNEQGMLNQDQLRSLTINLRKAADRLETLIGDMLDVSQLDLSAMDLRFVQTTIENVVRMAIEPLQESIRNRKQSLRVRGLRGLPHIESDMKRLVQAVRNLVLNAVKFTPDGGRIEIVGSLLKNEMTGQDEIKLSIIDSGIGIDKKHHEAIFEKFFRIGDPGLHSTGDTKFMGAGPGLGLTIAQGVINGHGGRIWVESEGSDPEKLPGTTFHIVLPLKPPAGQRRVMPFSTITPPKEPPGPAVDDRPTSAKKDKELPQEEEKSKTATDPKPPAPAPQPAPVEQEEEEPEPFVENNPTVLNPSASRAGLAAAAKAAAEKARADVGEQPSVEDNDSTGEEPPPEE